MTHLALPAPRALTRAPRVRRDRRDGVLALLGLALASVAFGAVVSGDPVPASDVSPTPAPAGVAQPAR